LRDITSSENQAELQKILEDRLDQEKAVFETVYTTKSGRKIPVEVKPHFFTLGDKNVLLYIARDITKRKKREEELKNYQEHLEELVEQRTAELTKTYEELRRTEEALRQSEEKLAAMFGREEARGEEKKEVLPMQPKLDLIEDLKLDLSDKAILQELQSNARFSMRQLRDKLDIPPTTIFNRIRRLKERGVLEGFTTILGSKAIQGSVLLTLQLKISKEQDTPLQNLFTKSMAEYFAEKFPEVLCCGLTAYNEVWLLLATTETEMENLLQQIREVPQIQIIYTNKINLLIRGQRIFTLESID
ncbi:MAG: winged helix-turn-helix transcriptional regulator, partial [Candidatus Hodarchaeota archaeon]